MPRSLASAWSSTRRASPPAAVMSPSNSSSIGSTRVRMNLLVRSISASPPSISVMRSPSPSGVERSVDTDDCFGDGQVALEQDVDGEPPIRPVPRSHADAHGHDCTAGIRGVGSVELAGGYPRQNDLVQHPLLLVAPSHVLLAVPRLETPELT